MNRARSASRRSRLRLAAVGLSGLVVGAMTLTTTDAAHADTSRYEAENAPAACDGDIESEHAGYSGTGFCNTDNSSGVTSEFTFGVAADGEAELVVGFANGSGGSRPADVMVNGATVASVEFDDTGAWTNWSSKSVTVDLEAGSTTVALVATGSDGLPNIDYLDSSIGDPPGDDNEAPSAPSGLEVTGVTGSTVNLAWDASTDNVGVAGYEVYRVGSPDEAVGTSAATEFTVSDLQPEQTYQFYVVAHDLAGNVSGRSETVSATTGEDSTDPPEGDELYVSPDGSDSAEGTQADPTTLTSAIGRIEPGGAIYLRGGTYDFSETVRIEPGNDGSASDRTLLTAYENETPVLDFSGQSEDSSNRGFAIGGDWWHIRGIVVEHAGDNGILLGGNNNIIEDTVTRYNHDTGLQLSRYTAGAPRETWPSNNLVLSSVSHDNADSDGEDADGFAPKLTVGPGNVLRYTVSHNNIDDGYDLYTKDDTGAIGAVTIENSLAFENGTLSDGSQAGSGDRNGFKLGGEDIAVDHVIENNIAYDNGKHGFTYNRNLGSMTVSGNVSIDNEERNFNFDGGSSVFSGNTSCYFDSSKETNDRIIGNDDGTNQFWFGSNGSNCSDYTGSLDWHFASDGSLVVTFGGNPVMP